MANNRIDELLAGTSKRDFARRIDVPEQTIYKICKKPTMQNISIDVFLKIAHGLGMTAEELYNGGKGGLTADEITILDGYRAAEETHKAAMLMNAQFQLTLAEQAASKKEGVAEAG